MHIFVWTILAYIICMFFRALILQLLLLQANTNMHNEMTRKILRATILFFDSNPSGRVSVRFSRDVMILDVPIPLITMHMTQGLFRVISVVIAVSVVNPYLLIAVFFGVIIMLYYYKTGVGPMIESQKLDAIQQGPINQTYTTVMNGLITLRSYRKFDYFKTGIVEAVEKSANATFCYVIAVSWVGLRLEMLCSFFGLATTIVCFIMKN